MTESLRAAATEALAAANLNDKVAITRRAQAQWRERTLSLRTPSDPPVPARPGRPDRPELVPPRMLKKRSLNTVRGRIALMHALAHIELNAIDLALDIVARFASMQIPKSFFDNWMQVADDEARHFTLLRDRLRSLDADYGDLPAHDGLWQAAMDTRGDLVARLAVVPLVLEARGLDVTPGLAAKLRSFGDEETAAILDVIYNDEKTHVAVGAKWFRFFCVRQGVNAADRFRTLVRDHFHGQIKPPFNDRARSAAGLTPLFYRSLSSAAMSR
ncbi:ferritin-like domain-containing protein [Oricola thermophila]|uniref:Ferritin-like domain-containing protein n=1 Tax=Oricola thermophila TaxID=2742145 RepID=A0A6N1VA41_9HYPH|nr:ferritin-like domain-containing protein [Oricola thermophila]QKV17800.1 ferritin-like domain-containing protein [Oricola thermophila]